MNELENNVIASLSILSGIPSIIAVTLMILLYVRYRELQVIEFTMIIYMLIGDCIITTDMVIISIW